LSLPFPPVNHRSTAFLSGLPSAFLTRSLNVQVAC
jgi:hypothetical protein